MAEIETTSVTPGSATASEPAAATVEALSRALELHDYRRGEFGETSAHAGRVTRLALELTAATAPELLHDPQLEFGFRLHDIGMIGVSSEILAKHGPLTRTDVDEIREHPWLGERIVAPVPGLNGVTREVIACHHERWDGSGYPRGFHADEIPLAARIFAIVDAFDAMTHEQAYRAALEPLVALNEIDATAGTLFDPELARVFVALQQAAESVAAPTSAV